MANDHAQPTSSQYEPAAIAPASAGSTAASGINRRALLRGSAAASPILMSLASGPVAATNNCLVASSFVSASVYKSRNPGAQSIACVSKTAQSLCDDAKSKPENDCNWAPYNQKVSSYVSGTVKCGSWNKDTRCFHVFRNSGTGLVSTGDVAILQRLLALGFGAPSVFTPLYCSRVWTLRSDAVALKTLVNDGANGWDQVRLLKWLDYSANGVPL